MNWRASVPVMKSSSPLLSAIVLMGAHLGAYAEGAVELEGLVCDRGTVSSGATGFFRLEQGTNGVWRFVTPGGHGFFLAANNGPARMTSRGD